MEGDFYRKERTRPTLRERLLKRLKNRRFVAKVLFASIVAGYVLFGDFGIVQHVRLRLQKSELEEKIRRADEETRRLQAELKALESDPRAIERVAREQHGMIRDGETVYRVNRK